MKNYGLMISRQIPFSKDNKTLNLYNRIIVEPKENDLFIRHRRPVFSGNSKDWDKLTLQDKIKFNWKHSDKLNFWLPLLGSIALLPAIICTPFGLFLIPFSVIGTSFAFSPIIKALLNKKVQKS